jgi:Arc/MetJ family transcription regulator
MPIMIEVDQELVAAAMKAGGLSSRRATIEEALRSFIQMRGQRAAIEAMPGLGWDGELDAMPQGRSDS